MRGLHVQTGEMHKKTTQNNLIMIHSNIFLTFYAREENYMVTAYSLVVGCLKLNHVGDY